MEDSIGFDLGGTKLLMVWHYKGETHSEKVPTGDKITPEEICHHCHDFIHRAPFIPKHIGMAVPGLLKDGVLIVANRRDNMVGLSEDMLSTKEFQFHLINDAKAAIYAEAEHYPKDTTLIVLVCGTGLGTGIKVNGTFVNGVHGWSTECGHIPFYIQMDPNENIDESKVLYSHNIMDGLSILKAMNTDAETLHALLKAKDPKAISVVEKGGFFFGLVIANLINMFNPKYIVIGGSTISYPGYLDKAIETAKKYALETNWNDVEFCKPFNLPHIVIDGAIAYAKLFE